MINKPTESELLELANREVDHSTPPEDRMIYMHFFLDDCHWYMSEYDPVSRRFFGCMIPGSRYHKFRWGHFSFGKLCRMKGKIHSRVVRNMDWKPRVAMQVANIRDAYVWREGLNAGPIEV